LGQAGILPSGSVVAIDTREVITAARDEATHYDKNLFRTGDKLERSLGVLHAQWHTLRHHLRGERADALRARETAAIVATARWSYTAALNRRESRGLHQREDATGTLPQFARRQIVSGLEEIRSNFASAKTHAGVAA
jgi:succinate dehydrogenase/fumarate reductase flavoprotein subunit